MHQSDETRRRTRWSCAGEGAYRSWGGHGRARVGRGGMRPSPAWVTPRRLGRGPQGRQVGRADSVPCAALAPIETVHLSPRNVLQSNILVAFRAHSFASPRLPSFFYTFAASLASRPVIHGADGFLYPLAVLFLISHPLCCSCPGAVSNLFIYCLSSTRCMVLSVSLLHQGLLPYYQYIASRR